MRRRPQTARARPFSFLLGVGLITAGCASKSDAQAVADAFVDAYYVEFALARAKAFTEGAATRRLEEEGRLVDEARKQQPVESAKSRVYYGAPAVRAVGEELVHLTYALDIRQDDRSFAQSVVVMMVKRAEGWKVLQFREERAPGLDRPSPPSEPGESGVRTSTTAP